MELISIIQSIALDQQGSMDDSEDTTNRQTALYSLKIMARIMASSHKPVFVQVRYRLLYCHRDMQDITKDM